MIVLAMDTANEFGSLALTYGEETLEEIPLHAPEGYSGVLFDQIGRLLKRNALRLDEVDVYAVAAGPGSFTGIRVGLSAAKALAVVGSKPCYGVSNLAAMASFGTVARYAAFIDARRGEIYAGVFGEITEPETVAPFPQWLAGLPDDVGEFLAFDFTPFEAALGGSRFSAAARTRVPRGLAAAIAEIALDRFRAGDPGDPAPLDANYVRRSDAELFSLPKL
jgi:tRNA threonylcarbamoyladenosine biosynthesis protein TsaB